jgi:hypothetical protein
MIVSVKGVIYLKSVNLLMFIMVTGCILFEVWTEILNIV